MRQNGNEIAFPYPIYDNNKLLHDYDLLKNYKINKSIKGLTGLKLVYNFHPSIWRCNHIGFKSPLDAWYDDNLIEKAINNRYKYLNKTVISNKELLNGLSIAKIAPKVSVFRPVLAKYLITKYLNEYNEIFDPCSGFSGRMLGTCSLNKKYIGQDINSITIKESLELKDFLNLDAQLQVKDSIYDSGEYDCLFTCPPYGDKENWHQDIEILSADEWIETCLNNYNCKSYLFVVDKTKKYKEFIVEKIPNTSHISRSDELVIFIKKST